MTFPPMTFSGWRGRNWKRFNDHKTCITRSSAIPCWPPRLRASSKRHCQNTNEPGPGDSVRRVVAAGKRESSLEPRGVDAESAGLYANVVGERAAAVSRRGCTGSRADPLSAKRRARSGFRHREAKDLAWRKIPKGGGTRSRIFEWRCRTVLPSAHTAGIDRLTRRKEVHLPWTRSAAGRWILFSGAIYRKRSVSATNRNRRAGIR